jgi:hypothetical protein
MSLRMALVGERRWRGSGCMVVVGGGIGARWNDSSTHVVTGVAVTVMSSCWQSCLYRTN